MEKRFVKQSIEIHAPASRVWEDDGITYELTERNGKTILLFSQGDFSMMAEGEKYQRLNAGIWDRVLPKVKELAEK